MAKKKKKNVKPKAKCCGKFRKKNKHCSRCPITLRKQCKLDTERSEMGKKKEDKKKAAKKAARKAEKKALKKKALKKKEAKKDKKK